jgi:hypothetical protein
VPSPEPARPPAEKPRRGLGALARRALGSTTPVLPLLSAPRSVSVAPPPLAPLPSEGSLPRAALEFLSAELRAILALINEAEAEASRTPR